MRSPRWLVLPAGCWVIVGPTTLGDGMPLVRICWIFSAEEKESARGIAFGKKLFVILARGPVDPEGDGVIRLRVNGSAARAGAASILGCAVERERVGELGLSRRDQITGVHLEQLH